MTTAEEEFVITHVFKKVSKLEAYVFSPIENHAGVPWKIGVGRNEYHLGVFLYCAQERKDREWSIEVWQEQKIKTVNGKAYTKYGDSTLKSSDKGFGWGWSKFILWRDLMKDYVVNDTLRVEVRVKIKKITGINLRNFDESTKEFSDTVLVVENKKFYVSKLFLASLSTFFKSTLLNLSKFEEHILKDAKAADFQKFLELLHGEDPISDLTVPGIVHLAHLYDAKIAIQKCEQYLIENSEKSVKEKLQLAHLYKLEDLKNHCLSQIGGIDCVRLIREAVADNLNEMDPSVVGALLQKSLDSHEWSDRLLMALSITNCCAAILLIWGVRRKFR